MPYRPGAGRKPRNVKFAGEIAQAEKWIADRLPFILEAQYDLALGVRVKEVKGEKERVYTKPPDKEAGQYLLNRVMGKPVERVEIDDAPINLSDLNDEELAFLERITAKLYGDTESAESPEPSGD
jgi:hypothetical protein